MLSNILGIITITTGLFWLIKPEVLKNRLKRKLNRKIKWIIYGFIIMFSFLLIGSAIKAHGFLMKIIALVGMIIAIRLIVTLTSKTSEKVINWWAGRPIIFFRAWALFLILFGTMLILS